ncbi:MAG: GGDEF domain-containing protein, partial [Burkholderiales bacterium]|nr:GGDEF domain-containing protein [Burkholderiales bacterium]
ESRLQETQLANHVLEQRILIAGAAAGGALLLLSGLLLRQLVQQRGALRLRNAQLRSQSEVDPLTGLANRRHLQRVMQRKGATTAFNGALLLLDLDHFKLVNDRHGHAAGDAVLVELARRLRTMLRDLDLVVRWGGEEFLIVAQGLSPQQVQGLAERLLATVGGTPIEVAGTPMTVTVSIGYASFPIEPTRIDMPWERALDLVDTALYLAKAHGRNRAYGVQSLHAQDSTELAEISRGLEAAWAAGRVALTPLSGPTPREASSAAESVT